MATVIFPLSPKAAGYTRSRLNKMARTIKFTSAKPSPLPRHASTDGRAAAVAALRQIVTMRPWPGFAQREYLYAMTTMT